MTELGDGRGPVKVQTEVDRHGDTRVPEGSLGRDVPCTPYQNETSALEPLSVIRD